MKNDEKSSTGKKLYAELKERYLIGDVAQKAGVYRHTVRRVLNSDRATPTQTKVMQIATEVLYGAHAERMEVEAATEKVLRAVNA